MVRLVSSRVHRCYSRSGGQRSVRNERLNDIAHLIACTTALLDRDIAFSTFGRAVVIPASFAAVGFFLLFVVHIFDLFATYNAHNMFYQWSRDYKKRRGFLSISTNVDGVVATCYFFSSVVFYTFASSIVLKGATAEQRSEYVHSATAILNVMGSFLNMTLSLPSQEYEVPSNMARAQNMVVALFTTGSVIKLYSALLETTGEPWGPHMHTFIRDSVFFANALIWFGSAFNFVRVSRFLAKVQLWIKEELNKNGKSNSRGLLSWFKSSKVNIEAADLESDDFNDVSYDDLEEAKGGK